MKLLVLRDSLTTEMRLSLLATDDEPVKTCNVEKSSPMIVSSYPANGWRYPLVSGARQRRFDGTNLEPRKLPENAQTPTSRVHAVLARFCFAVVILFRHLSSKVVL